MALKKLFRVKKSHIKEIAYISNYYCENAFAQGYVFIKKEKHESIYMLNSRTNKKELEIVLIENIEIVEG